MAVHDGLLPAEKLADREVRATSSFDEQVQYWRRQLEGASAPEWPIGQLRPTSMTPTVVHQFDVPQDMAT
ncbi:MAG: hypothetical protein M3332_02565, partial [Actinomycetota bacterium]|nr:hypothetical protein [Actinomycetota bacterium]